MFKASSQRKEISTVEGYRHTHIHTQKKNGMRNSCNAIYYNKTNWRFFILAADHMGIFCILQLAKNIKNSAVLDYLLTCDCNISS